MQVNGTNMVQIKFYISLINRILSKKKNYRMKDCPLPYELKRAELAILFKDFKLLE